jgi:N-acetyl sugar amidotransferase
VGTWSNTVIRCSRCLIPTTRPDTAFEGGICSACLAYERRPQIDWEAREKELDRLLDQHHGECLVPSSGGKDSHAQVLMLQKRGAHVTCITASTCMLTSIGRANIDNLARYATTIEVSPNKTVRAKLNRLGLQLVGDISYPEHVAIFTTPFKMAVDLSIPLVFYGESPQLEYGGPPGTQEAREMTMRWRSEFGGFLGLRPDDLVGKDGITERDMGDYVPPSAHNLHLAKVEAHFLGQYLEWDSHKNARIAAEDGMLQKLPTAANWWKFENLDNAHTGLHDHMMYRKFGYGRAAAQLSVDIRSGRMTREHAVDVCSSIDGLFPWEYAGVRIEEVLDRIGVNWKDLETILERFTNRSLFTGADDRMRPILKPCLQPA